MLVVGFLTRGRTRPRDHTSRKHFETVTTRNLIQRADTTQRARHFTLNGTRQPSQHRFNHHRDGWIPAGSWNYFIFAVVVRACPLMWFWPGSLGSRRFLLRTGDYNAINRRVSVTASKLERQPDSIQRTGPVPGWLSTVNNPARR